MKYTLTKANPDADVYPAQTSQTVNDPIEDEVNKNVFMGRLEDLVHSTANWGVSTHYGHSTLVHLAVMSNTPPL